MARTGTQRFRGGRKPAPGRLDCLPSLQTDRFLDGGRVFGFRLVADRRTDRRGMLALHRLLCMEGQIRAVGKYSISISDQQLLSRKGERVTA